MKTWTVDEMMAEKPCDGYPQERVAALWGGRERLTLLEVLRLHIPAADRVWVATRPAALPDETLYRWLDIVVSRAVETHALHCGVPLVER